MVIKSKYIFRSVTVLNLLLSLVVLYMAFHILAPFLNIHIRYSLPPSAGRLSKGEVEATQSSPPSPANYTIISEANLFHPERKMPSERRVDEQPLPMPEFVLYGTMISGNAGVAYMEDLKAARNSPGRGKRQITLKKGDALSGFTLQEVDEDKVVMVRGEEKVTLRVHDTNARNRAATIATAGSASAQIPSSLNPNVRGSLPKTRAQLRPGEERARHVFQR